MIPEKLRIIEKSSKMVACSRYSLADSLNRILDVRVLIMLGKWS